MLDNLGVCHGANLHHEKKVCKQQITLLVFSHAITNGGEMNEDKVLLYQAGHIPEKSFVTLCQLGYVPVPVHSLEGIATINATSLRDQMAMAALPECLRRGYEGGLPLAYIANGAYSMADAMLAARSAKGEK